MSNDKPQELTAAKADLVVNAEKPSGLTSSPETASGLTAAPPDPSPETLTTAVPADQTKIATAKTRRGLDRLADPARPSRLRRRRFPWRRVAVLVVILLAAGGGFWYYQANQPPAVTQYNTQPADSRRPVSVSISSNGQVQPNADLDLSFGLAGKIARLYKKPGDSVKPGDKLAELDTTDLQAALKAAQLSLDQEQARYQKAATGASQSDLEAAQQAVDEAVANLTKTANGTFTEQDVASANASINSATAQLNKTRGGPTAAETSAAQTAISAAQKQLDSAKAKLAQTKAGGSPQDVAAANAGISSAEAQLASAKAKLAKTLAGPDYATITAAQATYDQAAANYDRTISQLKSAIVNAEVARDQALNSLKNAQDKYNAIYWKNRNGNGQLKSDLKDEDIDAETQAKRNMDDAQGNYNKSDIALNDARVQLDRQTASLQSAIDTAKAQLDKLKQGPSQADIAADQASVASAQAALDNAKKTLTGLTPTEAQVAADEAAVTSAESSLASARKALLALYPTQSQIAADEAALASARASLARLKGGSQEEVTAAETRLKESQAALAELKQGPNPNDLAIAKASLDVANLNVEKAQVALEAAVLKAPFSGTILKSSLVEGQSVSAATAVYQLVDSSTLHVDVNVSETDIGKIKEGIPVAINLEGVPNHSFTGKVTFVSTDATVNSNVVSYAVTVTLDKGSTNSLMEAYKAEFDKLLGVSGAVKPSGQPASGGSPAGNAPSSSAGSPNVVGAGPIVQTSGGGGGGLTLAPADGICGYNPISLFGATDDQPAPRSGMSASVTFCLSLKAGNLSVPNRAVKTKVENNKPVRYVQVLVDKATGKLEDRPVLVGLVGDSLTEITGGALKEGDAVVTGVVSSDGTGSNSSNPGGPQLMIGGPATGPGPGKDAVFVNK